MLADYHVHTEFSDDSKYPLEELIKDAIKLHIDDICLTDHVDYGIKVDWDSNKNIEYRGNEPFANVDYEKYSKDIKRMQEKYSDKIKIKMGLEFGIQMHTIDKYEALFKRYPFDFIILSVHQVNDKEFWTQDFQKGKSQKEYNEAYYNEILGIIKKYKNYSVLGHLDLIVRYDENGVYPFENVKPIIEDILKIVINDNRGIEFNTSYHRYGLKDTTPSMEILKLYHKLGGKIITIGSDSHKPEHLGFYIKEAKDILKSIGFKQFCTYDKMIPTFHDL
ncbi:histidinol-phosphatase HisJ family protein [uncultured Brachyspira sp.]|uniref:histidinol-phosphatase HisJ family protein n=1 Tax=uncultured Brachyspira sp. TaxID=221953 RepID=UPI00262F0AA6|nr:histidinol-phosphatase HisJ family protein [uncultured Brachyspira sp.]